MKSLSTSFSFIKNLPRNNNPISNPNSKPQPTPRQLFLHKLSTSSPLYQTLYKTARPSLFSNPSTFFSSSFDGKEVIIGKRNSSFKISSLSPAITRVSSRKSIFQPQRSNAKAPFPLYQVSTATSVYVIPISFHISNTLMKLN